MLSLDTAATRKPGLGNTIFKMKKVLIFVDKTGPKSRYITSYLSEHLSGIEFHLVNLSDLFFELKGTDLKVKLLSLNKNLDDYDYVFFRRVGRRFVSLGVSTAICVNHFGLKFIDSADADYANSGPAGDKLTSLLRLSLGGLPTLHTIACWKSEIENQADYIISELGFPVVAKELNSQHGSGIRILRDKGDFKKLISEEATKDSDVNQYLFQKYIEFDGEYRFLVMGKKVRSVQKMYRDTSGYKLRIDMNRAEEFLPVENFPPEMLKIAVDATKALNLQIAGIDLAVEKGTGKVYLFEVNRGPGFTYDTKVSPEIPELAKFIEEKIESH